METKQLTTEESLDLITRMIDNTRRNFNDRGGRMFIFWGYFIATVSLIVYCAYKITLNVNVFWMWWIIPVAGYAYMFALNRKKRPVVTTWMDKVVERLWLVFGLITLALAAFYMAMVFIAGIEPYPILFIIALLGSLSVILTGIITRFRAITVGGIAGLAGSFALLFLSSALDQTLVFALVFLAAMVVPGHILRRHERNRHV